MQHTTNYALNQWEADDRVTREAFNADNAKIDAVLAAGVSRLVKLYDQTLSADATRYDINVAALGLSSYVASFVLIEAMTYEHSQTIIFRFDNDSESNYARINNGGTQNMTQLGSGVFPVLLLLRSALGDEKAHCLNINFRTFYVFPYEHVYYKKNLREVSTLNFTPYQSGDVVPAGTRFLVYGLKY